jgi:TolA-binding protein
MRLIAIISVLIFFTSCKQEGQEAAFSDENVQNIFNQYIADPSDQNARLFNAASIQYLSMNPESPDKKQLVEKGLEVAKKHNLIPAQSTYLITLIRDFGANKETPDRIFELATMMKAANREAAANTLFHSFATRYKDHEKAEEAKKQLSVEITDIDDYIRMVGEKIFEDPDETGVNKGNSQYFVDACEAYALANSNSVASPEFLYKASEIARTLRTFPKALTLYDWIINKYPDYEKAPTVLFLKGFLLENQFNDVEAAKATYQQFLKKYPRHELSDDVNFLLTNIGKSDDEIMKMIEEKSKQESQ